MTGPHPMIIQTACDALDVLAMADPPLFSDDYARVLRRGHHTTSQAFYEALDEAQIRSVEDLRALMTGHCAHAAMTALRWVLDQETSLRDVLSAVLPLSGLP